MNDSVRGTDDKSRWWLNPALARMAFGTDTQPAVRLSRGRITIEMERALRSGQALDLDDPEQRAFGEYDLLELIGQGGMGMVYRARQRNLEREVAIKLLSAGEWASEDLIETMRREARQAATLQHPNIVVVHELGEHAGLAFYVMELVPGHSLSHRLASDGRLPPLRAAALLRAVAEAVDYAHRMGVLHLDLKPGNILVDDHGEPRIADFGLARRIEQALESRDITGTPNYMAPEQARTDGPPLSPATDVWAIGAVLYEVLTGQPPFDAETPADTLRMVLDGGLRRPSELAPVPADLEAICLACLRTDPAQRYPHARAISDDLGHFLEGRAVSVRPLSVPRRMARWMRREAPMAITGSVMFASLLAGVAMASLQWQRAEQKAAALSARLDAQAGVPAAPSIAGTPARTDGDGRATSPAPGAPPALPGAHAAGPGHGPALRPLAIAVDAAGEQLAIAFADRSVRWYDLPGLAERGRLVLPPVVEAAAAPSRGDPLPAAGAGNGSMAAFSRDGRHALRVDGHGRLELWQVSPRKRLSAPPSPSPDELAP